MLLCYVYAMLSNMWRTRYNGKSFFLLICYSDSSDELELDLGNWTSVEIGLVWKVDKWSGYYKYYKDSGGSIKLQGRESSLQCRESSLQLTRTESSRGYKKITGFH
jgi:hypothetical protein